MARIKQLVWVPAKTATVFHADTPFGHYLLFRDGEVWSPGGGLVDEGWRKPLPKDGYDEGKAWAQQDFEKRVAACYEVDVDRPLVMGVEGAL